MLQLEKILAVAWFFNVATDPKLICFKFYGTVLYDIFHYHYICVIQFAWHAVFVDTAEMFYWESLRTDFMQVSYVFLTNFQNEPFWYQNWNNSG